MATVYVSPSGDDSRTYAAAQNASTPWAQPLKADASATAGDTVSISDGTYLSTAYTGAPTFHSFTKALAYDAANDGSVTLTGTSTSYVGRLSASIADGVTISFDGIVFDARSAATLAFDFGDMAAKVWTVSWTNSTFKDATANNVLMTFNKRGVFSTTDCTISGSPSSAGWSGATAVGASGIAGTGNLTVTHTRPVFDLLSSNGYSGITQDVTGGTPVNTVTYTVDAPTGTCETTSTTASINGVYLRCPGAQVINSDNSGLLQIIAPDNSSGSHSGIRIFPNAANMANVPVKNTRGLFLAPGGYAISYGDATTVASGTLTGGEISGNHWTGKYYASATPHGLQIGRATTIATVAANIMEVYYCNFLASRTTSGTSQGNISRDSYGVDFYIKGATAFTWKGVTAIQTGKYARRNLAPFSIDSQGGTVNVAGGFDSCTFICGEADFARVGALANITVNNSGTYSNNTYIIPDTWDRNTTDRFFVGGAEGGRDGATGYTIDEWMTGTAGSVSATNGTGTISVSGEKVIRLPIAEIMRLIYGQPSSIGGRATLGQNGWIVPPITA